MSKKLNISEGEEDALVVSYIMVGDALSLMECCFTDRRLRRLTRSLLAVFNEQEKLVDEAAQCSAQRALERETSLGAARSALGGLAGPRPDKAQRPTTRF